MKKLLCMFHNRAFIYGETKTGHTFPSYEKYLEYKEKQK